MRSGFTTGSCSAAAAKAAAFMLLGGNRTEQIGIRTPAGPVYEAQICEIVIEENSVTCGVIKDAGDDPDVTDKALILAEVTRVPDGKRAVMIEGGEGVGVVTRPGLDQPVGCSAINSVPRKMITQEVTEVMDLFDCPDSLRVVISVPDGGELAKKTFNPRLGITGGISIIGTTGIVEPMSTRSILETIRLELNQKKEEGRQIAVVSPGNYGLDFMKKQYGYDLNRAVKCANYIGDTIDIVRELGYGKMLLVGHVGKLIKLSGGIMNTHSKEADCRMELMASAAFRAGADRETLKKILNSVSTEEAYGYLLDAKIAGSSFRAVMERIGFYVKKRAGDTPEIACIVYSNQWGLLGKTENADAMIAEVLAEDKKEKEHD